MKTLKIFALLFAAYSLYMLFNFVQFISKWFDPSQLGINVISVAFIASMTLFIIAGIGVVNNKKWPIIVYRISFVFMVFVMICIKLFLIKLNPYINSYTFVMLNFVILVLLSMREKSKNNLTAQNRRSS